MNNSNGAISFEALLNTRDFEQGRFRIQSHLRDLSRMAEEEASKFDFAFKRAGQAVAAYFTFDAARNLVGDIVKVRGEFQQLEIAFTTMLQSKSKADSFMRELVEFAATTPFDLKSTGAAAKQLLAYGSAADSVKGELTMLGDVAAALSVPIGELVYLYGTLRSQGRAYAVDIRQFAGRGIPIYAELAKVLNVGKDEVNALVEAGKVGFPQVEKAFKNMTAAGSIFGGLMEAQSQSIPGKIERLKDAWDQMLNSIGKDSEGVINGTIDSMASLIENYQQVGSVLAGLAVTYGTYRAAVALSSVITSTHSGIVAQETVAKLAAIDVTIAERTAVLSTIEAKAAEALATENQLRAELSLLAAKEHAAIATAQSTAATLAEAEAKVAALSTSTALGASRRLEAANAELSAAATAHSAAAQEAESLTRSVNTKTVLLNSQSKVANTLATEVNTAANNLSAVSATRAAAAQATQTVAISAMTGRQVLAAIATRAQAAAQSFLNATMLANPYVAVAAAVVGLSVTLWALHDGTTEQEKAQKRLNQAFEDSKKFYDETKASISGYLSVIQSETATMYEKVQAYENLKNIAPTITDAYSMMALAAKGSSDAQKIASDQAQKATYSKLQSELNAATQKIIELTKASEELTKNGFGTRGNDIAVKLEQINDLITEQKNIVKDRTAQVEIENRRIAEAAELERVKALPLSQQIEYHQKNLDKLEEQKGKMEASILLAKTFGTEVSDWQRRFDAISLQNIINQIAQAKGALDTLGDGVSGGSGSLDELKAQKQDLEKRYGALGEAEAKAQKKAYERERNRLQKDIDARELKSPTKPKKPKKSDEKFLEGSLKYYEKEITILQEKMARLPVIPGNMDKIQEAQEKIRELTKSRLEAEKAIEIRTWQEIIDEKLQMYHTYEEALRIAEENDKMNLTNGKLLTASDGSQVEVFDASEQVSQVDKVKAAYAELTQYGETRIDFLIAEKQRIDEIIASGEANFKVVEKLVKIQNELDVLRGKSTPVESFRKGIDGIVASIKPYAQIIDELNLKLDDLNGTPDVFKYTSSFVEQRKIVQDAISDINKKSAEELSGYLVQMAGSEQKRAAIVLRYENLINAAREKGLDTMRLEKELKEELAGLFFEKSDAERGAAELLQAENMVELKRQEKRIREEINAAIQEGYGNTDKLSLKQKQLNDNLNAQADISYRNMMMWSQAIGQAGQELSQLEGVVGNIGQLFSSAAQSAQQFSATYANLTDGNRANNGQAYSSAVQSGVSLVGLVVGAFQKRKAAKKKEAYDSLQVQLDLNKAIVEEIRLRTEMSENVYVTNYYGRIQDAMNAMTTASYNALSAMEKLDEFGKVRNGTRNKIDWSAVGAGAGSGATIGTTIGSAVQGWGAVPGAVIGAVAGAIVGLFGAMKKDARFSALFEIYPELISQSGEFNQSLAETLIANDRLDDKTKQYLQTLIDMNEEWKAAKDQITSIVEELTGQMGGQLRDALVGAFEEGTDAAYAFAGVVEDTLQNALEQLIYSKVFGSLFDELGKNMENALMYYGMTNDLAGVYDAMAVFMNGSQEAIDIFNKVMEAAKDYGKGFGFNLWEGDDRANGLTGAIKGITEEQASVLAGNITQMRIKQAEHSDLFREQLAYLSNISSNSNYLPELGRLEAILRVLERMSNDSFGRSQGWNQ